MTQSRLYAFLAAHWWLTFLAMGASFVAFGLASLNLLQLVSANFEFLTRHGVDAVREGALLQLLELAASGYASVACYTIFKLCERVLVDRLSTVRPARSAAPAAPVAPPSEAEGAELLATTVQSERV